MTQARSHLVSLPNTCWYHVVTRCVRRAYLCGYDRVSNKNFNHRRDWVLDKISELAHVFAIDIAAFAIMSNHYHLIVRIAEDRADDWSQDEVIIRWKRIFSLADVVECYLEHKTDISNAVMEDMKITQILALYRSRLCDLSWFMRVLNESIARQANQEDKVRGRFWEGRFKTQALLDNQALLLAMVYVDLNPIRAGMAKSIPESLYTSIHLRLSELANLNQDNKQAASHFLMPFEASKNVSDSLPFAFLDYLELVDTMGRCMHPKKRGRIPKILPRFFLNWV